MTSHLTAYRSPTVEQFEHASGNTPQSHADEIDASELAHEPLLAAHPPTEQMPLAPTHMPFDNTAPRMSSRDWASQNPPDPMRGPVPSNDQPNLTKAMLDATTSALDAVVRNIKG